MKHRIYIISILVIVYMLSALTWWAILLYQKNEEIFILKKEQVVQSYSFDELAETVEGGASLQELQKEYQKQNLMIFGEAAVFALAMILGIWFLSKTYQKEIKMGSQQKNFLLSVTHEFKSPLSSIKLIQETLSKRSLDPTQVRKLAEKSLEEAERLEVLLNNILFAAKLETGYSYHFEEIDVMELLQKLKSRMENNFPEFIIALNGPSQCLIRGDRETLFILYRNLLENAIKYSTDLLRVEIHCESLKNYAKIEVKDFGSGIENKEKDLVFNKFYRVGQEETRKTKGTGLGLYLVKYIVDSHKGKISITDNNPKGTIVSTFLPAN